MTQQETLLSVENVSTLLNVTTRMIRKKIDSKQLRSVLECGSRGGPEN